MIFELIFSYSSKLLYFKFENSDSNVEKFVLSCEAPRDDIFLPRPSTPSHILKIPNAALHVIFLPYSVIDAVIS